MIPVASMVASEVCPEILADSQVRFEQTYLSCAQKRNAVMRHADRSLRQFVLNKKGIRSAEWPFYIQRTIAIMALRRHVESGGEESLRKLLEEFFSEHTVATTSRVPHGVDTSA